MIEEAKRAKENARIEREKLIQVKYQEREKRTEEYKVKLAQSQDS